MKLDKEAFWQRLKISGGQKKYIMTLIVVSLVGVAAILLGNALEPKAVTPGKEEASAAPIMGAGQSLSPLAQEEARVAQGVMDILQQVQGVGKVAVQVTLDSTTEVAYATENQSNVTKTNEVMQNGNTRTTDEVRQEDKLAMQSLPQGVSQPIVVKEARPKIVGVIVVAQGADNILIKEQIALAVQVLLDIPAHKVTVLAGEKERVK